MNTQFYPLVLDDGGRNFSKRPMQINDCTVRSLSIISKHLYDEVYDILAEAGREPHQGFDLARWLKNKQGKVLGGQFTKLDFEETKDHPELTPGNFIEYFPKGRYLLEGYNHVWAVVDGKHRDLWRMKRDVSLYGAWKFKVKK